MKAGLAIALMSASALILGSASVRAEESLKLEPLVAQSDGPQGEAAGTAAYIPLPPSRPAATAQSSAPRRIRVAQASIAPRSVPAAQPAALVRKPQIWLSMGYGF